MAQSLQSTPVDDFLDRRRVRPCTGLLIDGFERYWKRRFGRSFAHFFDHSRSAEERNLH
jgi:hypothetical protein